MTTVYVTAPADTASELARTLVEERLAACVNRFGCRSTYRWEGEVLEDDESALLIKTAPERYDDLESRIEEIHPYDVPCIERFEEADAHDSFVEWIEDSTD